MCRRFNNMAAYGKSKIQIRVIDFSLLTIKIIDFERSKLENQLVQQLLAESQLIRRSRGGTP